MGAASELNLKARELLAEALQLDVSEVPEDAAIGVTDRWDSLAHMRLIMALEAHLGKPVDTDAMVAIEDISGIVDILKTA
ncbi:MAG: acyl carrier protein [Alphaproteobacteria bacterium]|nr:MAG: acyl carrier protein [Alphaproteobacteria bacterium]